MEITAISKDNTTEDSASKHENNPDEDFKNYIHTLLEDAKAVDINIIELAGKSSMADYMVIASGTSSRHISYIAEKLKEEIKKKYSINCNIEGTEGGDWVVLDALDAVVHIFRPEIRDIYKLEKLWASDFDDTSFTLYSK